MASCGIVIIGDKDATIEGRAKAAGLSVRYEDAPCIPFDKTLIVESGTSVPFALLNAAWHFLDRWDAATPFWRYSQTAEKLGTAEERQRTQKVIRDLRVLTHAVELLFVRNNDAGNELINTWQAEHKEGDDKRLSFLRAFYTVKPRLCVLPTAWLNDVEFAQRQDMARRSKRQVNVKATPLVKVELAPGQFVKVHKGDEQKAIADYQRRMNHGRR